MTKSKELARVVRCSGDFLWVEPIATSGCSTCAVHTSCGTGVLTKLFRRQPLMIRLPLRQTLIPGDEVWLDIPQRSLLLASVVLYFLPLMGLLFSAMISQTFIPSSELAVIIFTLVGFFVSFVLARRLSFSLEKQAVTQIRIDGKGAETIFKTNLANDVTA